ncbi:unnamed protein product [Victoria cruziana]
MEINKQVDHEHHVTNLSPPFSSCFFFQVKSRKCGWIESAPLVCAHGGDSSRAFPNTMEAYRIALLSNVDCVEIDVSRTSDGALVALHDRELQLLSGNSTTKVGHLSMSEIKQLHSISGFKFPKSNQDIWVPSVTEALKLVSKSVRQVILDAKVGPPLYEKGLAAEILSTINKAGCNNCLIWSKSDTLVRDVIRSSQDVPVGYIIMRDPSTGLRTNLLRIKGAQVVGVYHPLIDEELVRTLHRVNRKVYAWTVDDADSMKRMLFEHVDCIITGHPSRLLRVMNELENQCLENGFLP